MHPLTQHPGRLRIYLGAAAGVGKTYAMLGDALLAVDEGADVIVGYLEPHGRSKTEERARGLERAPTIGFGDAGDRERTEPDVGAIIERRPSVVLIDELAHTNADGSARRKRHEDVQVLLDAGIDVWTTVNVQHLESLHDRVFALTGVDVRETFPDRLLHKADEIRLVDLAPGALRERISRGDVYPSARVDAALGGFFTPRNLTALRALALHELAEMAQEELRDLDPEQTVRPVERVLVATGGLAASAVVLVREGARLARRLDAELVVVAVEPEDGRVDTATRGVLDETDRLVRSLGGTFLRRRSDDAADTILREAGALDATQLVVGAPGRRGMLRRSPVEEILRRAHAIDVHVVARRT